MYIIKHGNINGLLQILFLHSANFLFSDSVNIKGIFKRSCIVSAGKITDQRSSQRLSGSRQIRFFLTQGIRLKMVLPGNWAHYYLSAPNKCVRRTQSR